MSRIDDGQVGLGRQPTPLHVQLAGAVAALTPDGVALEDWRLVAVQRPGYRVELVGVAEQAVGLDRALEVRACGELAVAGGDIPAPLLCEPSDRRLEEEAIALDQKGDTARPRAECEPDFSLDLGKQSPVRSASRCLVEHATVAVLDRVLHPFFLDWKSRSRHGSAGRTGCLRPARAIDPSGASGRQGRSPGGSGRRPHLRHMRPPGARSGTASRRRRRASGGRCSRTLP